MITYVKGSLFESPAKILVNTVNTVGVMGKGIAKTFKEVYPEMFVQYQQLCEDKKLQVGKLWLFKTEHKWILNFPTKVHWRQPSKAEYIEQGLQKFVSMFSDMGITNVAFPQLGCGNGELDWKNVVQPLMVKYLGPLPIDIFVYEYERASSPPEHRDIAAIYAWLRSEPRTLAFDEMWSDLRDRIGDRLILRTWDSATEFAAYVTNRPEHGLQVRVKSKTVGERLKVALTRVIPFEWRPRILGQGDIFIPQEAMLDLWQNTRAYGFCLPRIMPQGLDVLAPYVMALLARLEYMRPIELLAQTKDASGTREIGLQLFAQPHDRQITTSDSALAVHAV
jgi:O-acetyl-ADP-ribose deacetylase (regulator of RNase III)